MTKIYSTIIIVLVFYVCYYAKNNSIVNIISHFTSLKLFYRGFGGMSNIILGYYSSVYLAIMMKRHFKMEYIYILNKYYKIPSILITNTTHTHFEVINEKGIKNQYLLLENRTNIYLTTCHDILEEIIPLCIINISKCIFINLNSKNYIHEIYKLRRKLIKELLIPKNILINIYTKFRKKNIGFLIGIHIRTSIYSDFKEKDLRFYDNKTDAKYYYAIDYIIKKYKHKNIKLYIISDSTKIKYIFKKKYKKYICKYIYNNISTISHNLNDLSITQQYILSNCKVIIGSCASTYTLLSVFRYLHNYYAISALAYSGRGKIQGKCGYKLDYNHILI